MLGPLVLDWVGGEVYHADVVASGQRAPGERAMEFGSLSHVVSYNVVLCLGTGVGDNRLALGRPGRLPPSKTA